MCVGAHAPEVEGEWPGGAEETYDRSGHPPLASLVTQEEGGIHVRGALVSHRLGDLVPREGARGLETCPGRKADTFREVIPPTEDHRWSHGLALGG